MTSSPVPAIALVFGGGVFWFLYLECCIQQVAKLLISPDDQTSLIIAARLDPAHWVLVKSPYALTLNKGEKEPREGVNKNRFASVKYYFFF